MSDTHDSDFAARLELAWAAGFFDGEGSSYLAKASHNPAMSRIALGVAQVELRPLERFKAAVGIGRIVGPYLNGKYGGTAKPIWKWTCAGFPAKRVLALLWPYLTDVKKGQAERTIALEVNSGKPSAADRTHCPKGHPYEGNSYLQGATKHRRCRICLREYNRLKMRKIRARKKALEGDG